MRLLLDACVLYPDLVRCLLSGAAEAGFLTPLVSERVLDEWTMAAARRGGMAAEVAAAAARRVFLARFPDAVVTGWEVREPGLRLPDRADNHVLAAALQGRADAIITFNLKDFPRRALAPAGIAARHPDGVLRGVLLADRARMGAVVASALGPASPDEGRRTLKRAQLPLLGKAWAG